MAGFCPTPEPDIGMVQGLLGSVDCNVRTLAEMGYGALAQPGSPFAPALTGMLTLYVGFLGFQLLLGRGSLRVGDLTVTVLKIGVVLALATSWPTYQRVVFDVLFLGPQQLATSMLDAVQPPGSALRGNPFDGLQLAYDEMQRAAAFYSRSSVGLTSPLQGGSAGAAFALNAAALMMLVISLGVVLAAKIVLGLLLALGPIFVAFLLFDATRGVFEGWLRACVAFALAPLLATLSLIVQLILIEPHLLRLAETQAAGLTDLAPASAIFLLTLVATGVAVALMAATAIVATGLRLPWAQRQQASGATTNALAAPLQSQPTQATTAQMEAQPRVAAVAAAVTAQDRRESLRVVAEEACPRRM
ncbi:MAG: type IV secretion system protein, partial [bacterium]|nr:type IV secretion system protein [bacterium]